MPYATEVMADSPTAYWRLGESNGTTATDQVGAFNGTYVNSPNLGLPGGVPLDTAVGFVKASSHYMSATTLGSTGTNIATTSWEFWIKTTEASQVTVHGTFNLSATVATQCQLNTDNSGAVAAGKTYFYNRDTLGNQLQAHITTNIYDGFWHHVVWMMASTTTYTIYVDGASVTPVYGLQQALSVPGNYSFAMTYAARNLRGTIDTFGGMTLDELAVYPSRLSAGRVAAHYAAGRRSGSATLLGVG